MSKNIDIDNEEEILKECDFDYFYNSENCSSELCAFYNDIFRNGNNANFNKRQALIDLGRIGIVLNNQSQQIAEIQKQLEEKEKDNQFLKKMYLSERIKNDNYHTKKYGLDKPVEELRKIKLNPKEKEIYYKGFDNCERQFSTHIAELQQQLKSQPAEIVEEIKQTVKNNLVYPDNRIDCPFNDGYLDEETLCSIMDKVLQEYQKGEN